jgi:acetolactate synthase I/II/III large subunit
MTQTPAQVAIECVRREGVTTIFGLDGDHVIYLYDALADAPDIDVVNVMHENNASIAAELYARTSGKPGVVMVTAGPGALNSLPGIGGAYAAGVPIVHISGGVAQGAAKEAFHGVDDPHVLQKIFEPVTKWSVRIEDPNEIAGTISRAFEVATSGRPGPVHVEIAVSALAQGEIESPDVQPGATPETTSVDLDDLIQRIEGAGKVAMVAGKNAFWPDVSEAMIALAEHLQTPVVHVWDSHGAFPTVHPLSLGLWREGNSNEFVEETFKEADLVLGIGVREGTEAEIALTAELGDRFVMIDTVDELLEGDHISTLSIASLTTTLKTVVQSTRERPTDQDALNRCDEARRLFQAGMAVEIAHFKDHRPWLIAEALESLDRKIAPETIVISDVSQVKIWAPLQLRTLNSLTHLQSGSWGAMGYVVPGVLGAALARPDRKIVGIVGDSAFLMGSNDFGTMCALGLPVIIAVHADQQIGMIYYSLKREFGRTYKTEVPLVDFVAYAEAFGATGIRVDEPDQIDDAWERAFNAAASGPVLLELRAGHEFPRPYPLQRIIDQGRSGERIPES